MIYQLLLNLEGFPTLLTLVPVNRQNKQKQTYKKAVLKCTLKKKQKEGRSPYKYKDDYTMLKWGTDIMKFRLNCVYVCTSV